MFGTYRFGGVKMDQPTLQNLVEDVSLSYFNKPFLHQASFNSRLRTTGGRYLLQTHNIELNEKYYRELGLEELIKIIKHELCHYHLHLENKGYKHRDPDFKELLKSVGAPRFCHTLPSRVDKKTLVYYHYECVECKLKYIRKRRVNLSQFVCGRCKGKLREVK